MKVKIIFHKEDCDGVGSAALVAHIIREMSYDDCEIEWCGVSHNDITRMERDVGDWRKEFEIYDKIFILDISFHGETMKKFAEDDVLCSKILWIDHHKPIIEESLRSGFDNIEGLRSVEHSALYNTYKLLKGDNIPFFIEDLSSLDNWTWRTEGRDYYDISSLDSGLKKLSDLNPEWWLENMVILLHACKDTPFLYNIYKIGREIVDEKKERNKRMCEIAADLTWTVGEENRKAACVVLYGGSESMMFESLSKQVKNAIVMRRLKQGDWTLSLYNVNDDSSFHCGEYLSSKYGGGGHEGAAGCTVTEDEFINILKNKHL